LKVLKHFKLNLFFQRLGGSATLQLLWTSRHCWKPRNSPQINDAS